MKLNWRIQLAQHGPTHEDQRPKSVVLEKPTMCCASALVLLVGGTYRCPCGKRQENAAKAAIVKGLRGA